MRIMPLEVVLSDDEEKIIDAAAGTPVRQQLAKPVNRLAQRRRSAEAEIDAQLGRRARVVLPRRDRNGAHEIAARRLRRERRQEGFQFPGSLSFSRGDDPRRVVAPDMRREP